MLRLNFTVEPVMITGRIGDLILAYQPAVLATCSNAYTSLVKLVRTSSLH